ncbi:MAG: hypothetical protein ABII80_01165 [bacterium]
MIPSSAHPVKSKYFVITMDYLMPLLISLFVLFGAWLALFSPVFQVKTIECQQDFQPCENESLTVELNKTLGENIFRLNTISMVAKLTSGDYMIRAANIVRTLPSSILVDLQSVYPTVAIKLVSGENEWVILDNQSRVIGKRELDPNVPTVLVEALPALRPGQVISDNTLLSTLALARNLSSELPSVKTIELSGETIKLTLADGKLALLTTTKDQTAQIRTLQAILTDSTITSGVGTIDVRFSQPVLR